jgi:hypothetical protein
MGEKRNVYYVLLRKQEGKRPVEDLGSRWSIILLLNVKI